MLRFLFRFIHILTLLLSITASVHGNPGTCDHTPPGNVPEAKENTMFEFDIDLKDSSKSYLPDQTYVCELFYFLKTDIPFFQRIRHPLIEIISLPKISII